MPCKGNWVRRRVSVINYRSIFCNKFVNTFEIVFVLLKDRFFWKYKRHIEARRNEGRRRSTRLHKAIVNESVLERRVLE